MVIQDKVDRCEIPSSIGRIPHKIASSFSSFTADQWKTWTIIFSMYALHDMLYQEDLECWYLFVQACRILVTPLLKIDEAKKGHKMLLKTISTTVRTRQGNTQHAYAQAHTELYFGLWPCLCVLVIFI